MTRIIWDSLDSFGSVFSRSRFGRYLRIFDGRLGVFGSGSSPQCHQPFQYQSSRVWFLAFLGTPQPIFGISTICTWSWKKLQNLPSIIFTFPLSVKYSSSRAKWRKYTRVCDEIAIDITVRHCLFGVILSLSLGTLKNPFWPVVSQIEHFTQFLGFGDMTDVGSHCSKPKMLWIFYDFLFFRTYGFSREREFCLDIWRIERVTQATLIFFLDLQIFSYSAFIW